MTESADVVRPRPVRSRVVVVGLGPGGADLVVPAARAALESSTVRFARTAQHPAVAELAAAGVDLEPLDAHYDEAADLEECYRAIVATLLDAAREHGVIAYAVPGSPAIAERTVDLLRERARAGDVAVDVIPGLSFADLAWTRLGVDPMETGARVVDARVLDAESLETAFPTLVAQCDTPLVLSDVKLVLLDAFPADADVTVLQRLGLPDEQVQVLPLAELDRAVDADHLTAVFVPAAPSSPTRELARLLALAERLRRPGGCPWDAEQTHHSLTRYLLEESYEVVEAVETLPPLAPDDVAPDDPAYAALVDELGDLLYQVIFHAVLAEEAGAFGMADVARGIHDKLVRRHPHVFGEPGSEMSDADTADVVIANWEQIKKDEKGTESIVAGITPGLPSLLYAHKLYRKAASVGLDPGDVDVSLARIDAAVGALRAADDANAEPVLGELLSAAVALARALGVDTESALRGWSARFRDHFEAMEVLARDRGLDLHELTPADVEHLWDAATPTP